jgi:hypothetical protein
VINGERKAGCAMVSHEKVTEAWSLPARTSAQKAELTALTRALMLRKGRGSISILIPNMPSWCYMVIQLYGKKEDSSLRNNPQ